MRPTLTGYAVVGVAIMLMTLGVGVILRSFQKFTSRAVLKANPAKSRRIATSPAPAPPQYAKAYQFRDRLIICSVGRGFADGFATVLDAESSSRLVGEEIAKHLAEYRPTEQNRSYWDPFYEAVFLIAGAESLEFYGETWEVSLKAERNGVEILAFPITAIKDSEIEIALRVAMYDPWLVGEGVREALACAKALRECGLV
jgi:hypothetical protein